MRFPGTRRARLIIFISLVALLGAVALFLYARALALYQNIGPLLVAELERQLGREVAIGRVDAGRLGRVVLEDVALAEGQQLAGGAMFRADRIVITYSWLDLVWFRTDVAGSVRRILVEDPFLLLVRDRAGRLNVQDLLKPRAPGAPPSRFRAQVVVTRGRVVFRDYRAAFQRLPAENEVGAVEGVLDYRTFPRLTVRAAGVGRRGRVGPLQATTFIDTADGRWLLRAAAANADAAYWASYAARAPAARVVRGRANLELVVSRTGARAPVEYVLDLAAAGLDAQVARLGAPIRNARGFAQVTPYGVKLDASGSLGGMPVKVSGNILNWKNPQLALSVRGEQVTLAGVRRVLPQVPRIPDLQVVTPGEVEGWVLGPAAQLYATGSLAVPALSWRGERVRDARVSWRFHTGMLQFDQVSAEAAAGGRLTATGWARLRPDRTRFYVTGRLEDVNLAALPGVPPRQTVRGRADVQFAVSGTPQDPRAAAAVQFSHLVYNQARLAAAAARLDYQHGILYVRSLTAEDNRGRLVAAGTVKQRGVLDLKVRARGIDLAALLAPFTRERTSGIAYFSGNLGGTTRDPRLAGRLQVYAGQLGSVSTDYAEGQIVLRRDRVATENLVLRVYPGQVTLRGSVSQGDEGRPRLDLTAELQELSLARLLAMAEVRARVTGTLSGDLALRGDPTTPVAAGTLRVEDLLVEGARLGTATARLETGGGRLWVRQATIEGEALAASAHGSVGLVTPPDRPQIRSVTKESPLNLSFAVERLDLERVSTRAGSGVLLQGQAQATEGLVRGRVGAPVVTARMAAAPITVNGVEFARLEGRAHYTAERVSLQDVVLRENGGTIQVTQASLLPRAEKPINSLTVDATVTTFPLQLLIEAAQNTASVRGRARREAGPSVPRSTLANRAAQFQEVQGPVSGTLTARPEPGGESVLWTAALNAPALTLPGYRLAPAAGPTTPAESQPLSVGLEAQASYSTAGRFALERLAITRDEGVLLARGSAVQPGGRSAAGQELPDGQITLRVDATEIPMGLFGPLAPSLHPLRGVGELHVDAEGPLHAPTVQASMDVEQLALAGVPFSHLSIPYLQVAPGKIEVQNARLDLARDGQTGATTQPILLVDGTVPFRWETNARGIAVGGRVPDDQPLALTVRVPEQSLEVLNTLAKLNPQGLNPRARPVVTALGSLSALSGQMAANVAIAGKLTQPDFNGSFSIQNAAFQPQKGETRFEQIAVQLDFKGNRLDVVQFRGRSSNGGSFEGSGDITGLALGVGDRVPAARLNLALAVNDLRYTERNLSGYFRERFRGTIRTVDPDDPDQRAPVRLVGDWRAPTLSGVVQLRNTRLQLPGSFPEGQARTAVVPFNPQLQFTVLLGRDVWLETPRLRMQLAGPVPIRGRLSEPIIRGTLVVERGQLIFPTARFRVEGAVTVAYTPGAEGGAEPLRVDLTATTRLRGTDRSTGQRQRYDVTLVIRGPLTADAYEAAGGLADPNRPTGERLTIEARSDPPLSQQQVLALLGRQSAVESILAGGRDVEDVLRQEITETLVASVIPTLFTPLETAIEDWLGLDEFSLDVALREPVQVRLTKQLYGPLHATYTHSLDTGNLAVGQQLYSLELFYRFQDRFRVGYRIEEPNRDRVLFLNGTFRF